MSILEFLYLSLAIGFLLLVGFIAYVSVKAAKTLQEARLVLSDVRDTTKDIRRVKNQTSSTILSVASFVLKMIGGEKRG